MRAVDFEDLEAGIERADRRVGKRLHHGIDVALLHGARQRLAVDRRHCAGGDRLPGFATPGLVVLVERLAVEQRPALGGARTGVSELHCRHAAELLHEFCDAGVFRDLVVAI